MKKPSDELREFGDCYSIVDLKSLELQIKNHIVTLNKPIDYLANWVNLLGEKYSGVYSPFCKFPEWGYQNEYRIVLLSDTFLSLEKKEPHVTVPPIKELDRVFSEPQPLDTLLHTENINAL